MYWSVYTGTMFFAMNPILSGTLAFSWLVYVWDCYLARRQRNLMRSSAHPPKEVRSLIDEATFAKSRLYQLDKSNFAFYHGVYSQMITTALIFGGLPVSWYLAMIVTESIGYTFDDEFIITGIWILIFSLFNFITELPWDIYSTFVIEEHHGFNKQTPAFFAKDKIKNLVVWTPIVVLIIVLLVYIIQWGGDYFFIYVWAFFFAVTLILATVYPNYIAPLFDKFTLLPEGELRTAIEDLASGLKFPLTKLYVVEGSKRSAHSNAYLYGFFNNKRIVLFDTLLEDGLMPKDEEEEKKEEIKEKEEKESKEVHKKAGCNIEEILAVLSHELGHWKFSHVLKNLVIMQANTLLSFFAFGMLINETEVYVAFGFEGLKPTIIGLVIVFQFLFQPYNEILSFVITQLTRRFEFQADSFAKELKQANALKSALMKLYKDNLGFPIADPLYAAFNHSHPSLVERLRALEDTRTKKD